MDHHTRFIADVHMGRLARMLRMLGIDTYFRNDLPRPELLRRAHDEQRILLTRNRQLPHNPFLQVLLVTSEDAELQLRQVLDQYPLQNQLQPFTLCLLCNTPLHVVPKEAISHLIPDGTRQAFTAFWQCPQCGKVFWKGSHYERMMKQVAAIAGSNL